MSLNYIIAIQMVLYLSALGGGVFLKNSTTPFIIVGAMLTLALTTPSILEDHNANSLIKEKEKAMEKEMQEIKYETTLDITVVRLSGKAILIKTDEDEEIWLPKSQVMDGYNIEEGYEGILEVADWLADDKGLI